MAGEIAYRLTADQKAAVDAMLKLADSFQSVEGGAKKVKEETKLLAKEQEELGRQAKRVWDETRTPLERYEQEMAKLSRLYQEQKIDTETLWRAQDQAYKSMQEETKKSEEALKKAGHAHKEAFGAEAVSEMKRFALELVGVGGGLETVRQLFEKIGEVKREAAQSARTSEFGYGSLAQVSGGKQEKYEKNVELAKHIATSAGMSENQATQLTFALVSAGAEGEADTFSSAFKTGVVANPESMVRASTALSKAMGMPSGSLRRLLNLAMGAGEAAPSKAEELLAAAARGGAFAATTGVNEKELLAGTAVNATVLDPQGGAAVGGTAMASLLKSLTKLSSGNLDTDLDGMVVDDPTRKIKEQAQSVLQNNKGKSLLDRLKALRGSFRDDELIKALGRTEAYTAMSNILKAEGDYSGSIQRQGEADQEDLFHKVVKLPGGDRDLAAAQQVRIQKAAAEEAAKPIGRETNLAEAYNSFREKEIAEDGGGAFQLGLRRFFRHPRSLTPGAEALDLKNALLDSRLMKEDFNLYHQIVEARGGEGKAFDTIGKIAPQSEIEQQRSEYHKALQEASKDLKEAARHLKESQHARQPTLGRPDRDR
jgi:hypothetical protein